MNTTVTRAELVRKAKKYGLRGIWRWEKEKLHRKIAFIETAKAYRTPSS